MKLLRAATIGGTLLVVLLCSADRALTEETAAPEPPGVTLELYPTFHCIGVRVSGWGEGVLEHRLEYRPAGDSAWSRGHPLTELSGGRLIGSLFFLKPNAVYEVRVSITPRTGPRVTVSGSVRTRGEEFPAGSGRTYYVSAAGGEPGDGSRQRPFSTIQQAVDRVEPGDVVTVLPGTYREVVTVARSGRPRAYITIRAEGDVFLSGAFAEFEGRGGNRWAPAGGGVFVTRFPTATGFVAADGERLYHYPNRKELQDLPHGEPGGWFLERGRHMLYVKLADGSDPDEHSMQIGQRDHAFVLRGVKHVIVEGFRMGYFGAGPYGRAVVLENSSNCVVRKNTVFSVRTGIAVNGAEASDNLIEENEIWDNSIYQWPWRANKAHDTEGAGVSVRGRRGNVVRRNRIHGPFNAIASSMWGDLDNEERNADLDVYENELYDIGDDCLEPEGACINNRFWGNVMHDCHMGVSLAPIRVGPTYVLRNVVYRYVSSAIKYSVSSFGVCYIYHNTAYTDRPEHNALSAYGPWGGHIYRNNIFRGTRYVIEDTTTSSPRSSWDYDCLHTTNPDIWLKWENIRYNSREAWVEALGFEKHGLEVDPKLVDPENGDLHLRPDSPCIDVGVPIPNINDDFSGRAPDMGCFEYREK